MAVITSRNPGFRPETIRTRLARFMPSRTSAGWSVAWSASYEHSAEISDEHELQAAEHLGCYGTAVGHALAQAELTPQRLRLTAESSTNEAGTPVLTIEVRAQINGPAVDHSLFDAIVHRAEPGCPVLKGLASEVTIRLVSVLDDSLATASAPEAVSTPSPAAARPVTPIAIVAATPAPAAPSAAKPQAEPKVAKAAKEGSAANHAARAMGAIKGLRRMRPSAPRAKMQAPRWLTTRMAVLMVVACGTLAAVPVMWNG
jgi:OsmC-like protein